MKLNKSQEELDSEKKWDKLTTFIFLLILMVCWVYFTGKAYKKGYENGIASVEPQVVYVSSDLKMFTKDCSGEKCLFSIWYEGNKVISILKEQKECEDMGGEFYAVGTEQLVVNGRTSDVKLKVNDIVCTSPAKTLFKYDIK